MSVQVSNEGVIELKGVCSVDDAEPLLQLLVNNPEASVDWHACESVHAAVLQILLSARVLPQNKPMSSFLRDVVMPNLEQRV